jgi:hypothetical protein
MVGTKKGAVAMWWFPAASLLALGMLLYVTSALHSLSFSPLVIGRQEAARDAAVREALAQHGAQLMVGNDRAAPTIQLQAGEHPGAERLDIPIPPDARLIGARTGEDQRATQIRDRAVFATPGDVAEVLAFYRVELAADGWQEIRAWMARPAHGASGHGGAVSAFCRGVDTPTLLVGVVSEETGSSQLRLFLDAASGLCASSPGPDPWNGSPPLVF